MNQQLLSLLFQYGAQLAEDAIEAHHQKKMDELTDEQVLEAIVIRTPKSLIEEGRQKAREGKFGFKTTIAAPPAADEAGPDAGGDDEK